MHAHTIPTVTLPSRETMSPDESMAAPAIETAMAVNMPSDGRSLKKSIIAMATASGYMKCMIDATPLAMLAYANTRLSDVVARKRLSRNTTPKLRSPYGTSRP